jgi:catechol 2,3-dioxygenase-like lactoylglutathione lyase family enzyme
MPATPVYPVRAINQISVAVRDLDKAMANYWNTAGIGPWKVYTYAPPRVKDPTYHGKPAYYKVRLALAFVGTMLVELIEHVEGDSVVRDFLETHGEGMHHFGIFVPDLFAAIREVEDAGLQVLQSGWGHGKDGDGGFAFVGTEDSLSTLIEIIQVPRERMDPDYIFPTL